MPKLDYDCVRYTLLEVEKSEHYSFFQIDNIETDEYPLKEIVYTLERLNEANYISFEKDEYLDSEYPDLYNITLTWDGHQFLDDIRDDNIWKDTKDKISTLSSVSLPIIQQVAVNLALKYLGIS